MNKKGQTPNIATGIIAAILVFMIGSMMIEFLKDEIVPVRASNNLDCTNTTISDGAKVTCLGVDIVVPYFFLIILSLVGGVLTSKMLE